MMENKNRVETFLDIFRYAMQSQQQKQSACTLGNRLTYIGLSDLARYQECPRNAVASKLNEKSDKLSTLLTLGRGHWFEQGVAESFEAMGLKMLRQLEISCTYQITPIRGHLDIVLVWEHPYPAVRILEIKSMDRLPQTPHPAHEWQVSAQTGLLKQYWNEPVFSMVSESKEALETAVSFPELCKRQLGLQIPLKVEDCSVEGWLLGISMKDAVVNGPYSSDREFMENLNIQGATLWQQLQQSQSGQLDINDIPHAQGFYPLCDWCDFNADCPKFIDAAIQPQWEAAITRLDSIKQNRASLEAEIKEIEKALKFAYQQSEVKDWISTERHRFKAVNAKGRLALDKMLLREELIELFRACELYDIDVDALLSRCEREGTPSTRLTIQSIKQEQ